MNAVAERTLEHPALDEIAKVVEEAAANVEGFCLSDAIRAGSTGSEQSYDWREGDKVCALSAAALAVQEYLNR